MGKKIFFISRRMLLFVAGALGMLLLVLFFNATGIFTDYIVQIINISLINVILAVSLNLINGFTGQFSIGHMGFAAVGAYTSATVTTLIAKVTPRLPYTEFININGYIVFILALLLGGIVAAGIGFLIGFPSLRLKGDYLAIITLGFGEIIRTIFNNIDYVGGPRGLLGIPKFSNLIMIFVITLLSVIAIRNLVFSTHGRALLSIRENELASELVGVNTVRYKITAFTIGAFFAGIAGGLQAHLLQIAHPTQYGFLYSILVLIMVYAGGMGSITGSIIAAFALTFLSEGLRTALPGLGDLMHVKIGDEWRMVVYSLLLIIIMLFRTEGLMGMREMKLLVPEEEEHHGQHA
ncbi:MAG TPA: branched-chain amino acid ABC transporter permease [Spirochaetia bacterium]|nr:branched-chain amino acid ABC transporter permease [Spirochaetia bacterium]